jgi:hypothetical protein
MWRMSKSMRMRWVYMGAMRNAYKILVRKSARKRPLRIPRHRWKGSIKMDLVEIMWEVVDWIRQA